MVKFKDFKIGYFFTMESGRNVTKNLMVNEGLPVIQGGETNRGVIGYVSEDFALANKLTIIEDPLFLTVARVGESAGYVALNNEKSVIGDNAKVLRNKFNYSLNVMIYLQTCLNKFSILYNYSNVVSEKNYLNLLISLPVTPDGTPDYLYMESYIIEMQREYIDSVLEANNNERKRLLSIVGLAQAEYERVKGSIELVDAKSYGEFKVGDLFDGYIGTFVSSDFRKEKKDSEFTIPLITSQTTNNGIQAYVKEGDYRELQDCLSIAKDGSPGKVFYQKGKFALGNVAMGIFAKESYKDKFNESVYLYIGTQIEKTAQSFGSYSKKVGLNLFDYTIKLPTTSTGELDYAYMEDYISKIKLIYIYTIGNYLLTNK